MTLQSAILAERAGLYELLRRLYEYPLTGDLLRALETLEVAPDSPLAESLLMMQHHLRRQGEGAEAVEALNVEMTRLFEGPGRPVAPPYASFYLHQGQLMGPAAQAARRVYLQQQVLPAGGAHLPDDHLALELGFLAYLADAAVSDPAAAASILSTSQLFLREHLSPWLSRFTSTVRSGSEHRFFNGLARFTEQAIAADLEWLADVLDDCEIASGNAIPVA